MNDEIQSLTELINKAAAALEQAVNTYGETAVNLTLEAARIAAISDILPGVIAAFVFIVGATVLYKSIMAAIARDWPEDCGLVIGCIGGCMVSIVSFLITISYLFQPHAWVGMFKPEVYLVYIAIFG